MRHWHDDDDHDNQHRNVDYYHDLRTLPADNDQHDQHDDHDNRHRHDDHDDLRMPKCDDGRAVDDDDDDDDQHDQRHDNDGRAVQLRLPRSLRNRARRMRLHRLRVGRC